MSREIRPATAADVAALLALDTVATHSAERREAIAGWVSLGQCHVACDAGVPVGYAVLTRSFFHYAFIDMLMVAETARRSGVGRDLVEHCASFVPGEKLWTSTNESNAPMRALLEQAGFVRSGQVDNLDPGDPELIYLRWPATG